MIARAAFAALVVFAPFAGAEDFSKAFQIVEPSTVFIRALGSDDSSSLGTGFFINDTGLLVTNAHVVEGASSAVVQLSNGAVTSVTSIKAIYPEADIAFLHTGMTKTEGLNFVKPDDPKKGAAIGVLGNPKGLDFSFSTGVVAGFRRTEHASYVQFTAPVSIGSSGSPVFNPEGEVLGLVTFILKGGQNLNFAVDADTISRLLERAEQEPQIKWTAYDPFRDARAPTQTEMTLEAVADYASLEAAHQKLYDEIIAIYSDDKEFIEYLHRGQRAWIGFRDAHIRSIWPAIETESRPLGTAERMCIPIELEILTRQRIRQLLTWRNGIEEGDVGAGTRMTPESVKTRESQLKMNQRWDANASPKAGSAPSKLPGHGLTQGLTHETEPPHSLTLTRIKQRNTY